MRSACTLTVQEAGAWPEDVTNPPTILVFEPTATMSNALLSEMKVSPKPHEYKQICACNLTPNKYAPTKLLLCVRYKFSSLNDVCPPFIKVAGPVIDFGPPITFRKKVTIKLPLVPGTVAPPEGFSIAACVGMCVRACARTHSRAVGRLYRKAVQHVCLYGCFHLHTRTEYERMCAQTHIRLRVHCILLQQGPKHLAEAQALQSESKVCVTADACAHRPPAAPSADAGNPFFACMYVLMCVHAFCVR